MTKRLLFFAEALTFAHVVRPFVLAEALDQSHYTVHFACSPNYYNFLSNQSFQYWPLQSISAQTFATRLARGTPLYTVQELNDYVEEDLKLIDSIRPDMVIGDFRLSLAISATLRHIPYVNITNAHWSPFYRYQQIPFPDHPLEKIFGLKLATSLFNAIQPIAFYLHQIPMNRVRKRYGLPALTSLHAIYTHGDVVLYADIPELLPCDQLPSHHHYLGPILWSPQVKLPTWWATLPETVPCIYISLGSSGAVHLLPKIIQDLATWPGRLLVATAGREIKLATIPDNCYIADYLPALQICERASLVINNGGTASGYQAVAQGKPVLGIPSNMDQFFSQQAIVRAGAGELVRTATVSRTSIQQMVTRMLNESCYTENAQKIATFCQKYQATHRFVHYVAQYNS
jgi:UDP:flavonoid glycosyltransferase YjiC (YdhE family)